MIPFDRVIWDAGRCAEYLRVSKTHFLNAIQHAQGFPAPLPSPVYLAGGKERRMDSRWKAEAVTEFGRYRAMQVPAEVVNTDPLPLRPACLYRHFSKDGELLYVGISLTALHRLARHRLDAKWFNAVATVSVEHYLTRYAALDAERAAIQAEKPKFNVMLNR